MGTIRNEMVIVHHWDENEIEKVREDAIKFFSEIASKEIYVNREYTFVINGDCSKLGWTLSELFHEARMKWCKNHQKDVQSIVVINFGEGDEPCCIVFDSTGLK